MATAKKSAAPKKQAAKKPVVKTGKKPVRVFGAAADGIPGKSAAVLAEKIVVEPIKKILARASKAIPAAKGMPTLAQDMKTVADAGKARVVNKQTETYAAAVRAANPAKKATPVRRSTKAPDQHKALTVGDLNRRISSYTMASTLAIINGKIAVRNRIGRIVAEIELTGI